MMTDIEDLPLDPSQLGYPRTASERRPAPFLGVVSISCGTAGLGLLAFELFSERYSLFVQAHPRLDPIVQCAQLAMLVIGFTSGGIGCFSPRDFAIYFAGLLINSATAVSPVVLFLSALGNL